MEIPGNLLAEGEYTVGVSIFKAREKKMYYCKVNDAVVFQVYDPLTGNSARGDCTKSLEGLVRPLFQWKTDYQGADIG